MKIKLWPSVLFVGGLLLLALGAFSLHEGFFSAVLRNKVDLVADTADISTSAAPPLEVSLSPNESKLVEKNKEKNTYIVQQLNQVIWVVAGVLSYNDVRFLEEADKVLSESYIDVTYINDPEIIRIIRDIRDLISDMRIEEGDRKIMEQEIAARRANALWDSLSSVSATGLNPASCTINLLSSSVQSYANYKRETKSIERDFKKQQWELDKKRLKELSDFNTELLEATAILMKSLGVTDDSQRLSVADAQALRDQLKGGYTEDVLTYLISERTEYAYRYLPEYWYHRGARMLKSADECKDAQLVKARKADARKCFETYQEMFSPSFRRSRDAVTVAAGMLKLLGEEYAKGDKSVKAQMLQQAAIIERFSDQADLSVWWQDNFILYTTYRALGERDKATKTMKLTVSALKTASSLMTLETISKPIGQGSPRPVRSYAQPIALCMQAMSNEYIERVPIGNTPKYADVIDAFLKEEYAAVQTKMSLAGKISEDKQAEIVKETLGSPPDNPNAEVVNCAIWEYHESENAVIFQIPIKFFLTDDTDCSIGFTTKAKKRLFRSDKPSKSLTVNEQLKTRKYLHPEGSEEIYAVQLEYKIKDELDVDIDDFDAVRLEIMHKHMPVALIFSKEYRDPVIMEFGKEDNHAGGGVTKYRSTRTLTPVIKYDDMKDRFEEVEEVDERK